MRDRDDPSKFYPRFGMDKTVSFDELDDHRWSSIIWFCLWIVIILFSNRFLRDLIVYLFILEVDSFSALDPLYDRYLTVASPKWLLCLAVRMFWRANTTITFFIVRSNYGVIMLWWLCLLCWIRLICYAVEKILGWFQLVFNQWVRGWAFCCCTFTVLGLGIRST